MSNAMTAVPPDSPLMQAWLTYQKSADYENTRRWALVKDHVDGSLWAAFVAGFNARVGENTVCVPREPTREMLIAASRAVIPPAQGRDLPFVREATLQLMLRENFHDVTLDQVAETMATLVPFYRAMIAASENTGGGR